MGQYELLVTLATAIFAVTGVLAAARQSMDALSFVIIGVVTAIGGGTLRDLVLDVPVFWLLEPDYLTVPAVASALAFFFERWIRETERLLLYLDGIATAMFAGLALQKTLVLGHGAGVAVVMAVIAGAGGGIIRDVMTGHPTILLRRELYITPIIVGCSGYFVLREITPLGAGTLSTLAIAIIAAIRIGSVRWGWAFPDWLTYRTTK